MGKCSCGYAIGHPLVSECRCKKEEWIGLTDEEIEVLWSDQYKTGLQLARAIEQALKEKNT